MKRLTFDGVNDLYQHPRWGAVTLGHAAYLDALKLPTSKELQPACRASDALELRNERHIDQHGSGMY